jgi:pimeloyl-ACP methyl ester carboxylesterase
MKAAFVAAITMSCMVISSPARSAECAEGAYQSRSGDLMAITSAPPPPADPGLRFTMLNGAQGKLDAADAPVMCKGGVIEDRGGAKWTRIAMTATPTTFAAHDGVKLHGLLLEPETSAKPPLVVLVHGSEKSSPILRYYQLLFAAQSVSVFAYDKRGTGKSEGTYTQDFDLLSDDAAAAMDEARRMAKDRAGRVGFFGGSQGGWIAPAAALKSHADFVEVGFGMVATAIEQDQWQVDYQLAQQGFPPTILPRVHEITDATATIARSNFTSHLDTLDPLRAKYGSEPWFARIDGQYSGELLQGKIEQAKEESPQVPWDYSGADVVRGLKIPQLWVLAKDDSVAPSARTIERLEALEREGADIKIVVFPHTDHGIRLYTVGTDGTRRSGAMADGYLRLLADWAQSVPAEHGQAVPKSPR